MTALDKYLMDREVLELTKRSAEAALKRVKGRIVEADKGLLEAMNQAGIQKISTDAFTTYLKYERQANAVDMDKLVEAFQSAGMAEMVTTTVNSGKLKSWVKDLTESEDGSPTFPTPELAKQVKIFDQTQVRLRKRD